MNSDKLQIIKKEMHALNEDMVLWDSGIRLEKKVKGIVRSFDEYMESRIAEIELEIAVLEKVATNDL